MGTQTHIEVIPAAFRRALRRAAVPALGLTLALAGAGAAAAVTQDGPAAPSVAATGTTALWLSGSSLSYADAQEASQLLGWNASAFSLPGVGFSRGMEGASGTLLTAAHRVLPADASPEVVVLQGGEADNGSAARSLSDATADLIEHVQRSTDPGTRVVVVGPIPGRDVPDSLRRINEVLARVAQQHGADFVDALAEGWQAGSPDLPQQLTAAVGG